MYRTIRMTAPTARHESENLRAFVKRLEKEIGEKYQRAASIAGPVFETMHKLASEYADPHSAKKGDERFYVSAMALTAQTCIAIANDLGLNRSHVRDLLMGDREDVPVGDVEEKKKALPYLEAMAHFQYLLLERLCFHEEKEESPFFEVVGGLWWKMFDCPLLPISTVNISLMRHALECICPLNDEFVPFLQTCPMLFKYKLVTKPIAKRVALDMLREAVKESEDFHTVTFYGGN